MRGWLILLLPALMVACGAGEDVEEDRILQAPEVESMEFKLTSPAFNDGEIIPGEYTCDGADRSPPLAIEDIPQGTKTLALVCDDPDAPVGTWDHWVIWNIIPTATIAEGAEPPGVGGRNSWGRTGYGGPCPPSGVHRYFFKLYALDAAVDLPEGSTKQQLEEAMQGHILAQAELMGKYTRE